MSLSELLIAWLLLGFALYFFALRKGAGGGAMTLSYFLGLSLLHVPGAYNCLSALAGYSLSEQTRLGFEVTVYGMAWFVVGATVSRLLTTPMIPLTPYPAATAEQLAFGRSAWGLIYLGGAVYFVVLPLSSQIPSATAVVSAMAAVLIVGIWFFMFEASRRDDLRLKLLSLAALPVLPLMTLISSGFAGYGSYWAITSGSFLFVNSRRRLKYYVLAPFAAVFILSLATTYFIKRAEYRELAWVQQVGLVDRFYKIIEVAGSIKLYDSADRMDFAVINSRLNQNYLVGLAVQRKELGLFDYLSGGTLQAWVLIPRVVWPEKPEVGGSGDLVSRITGLKFDRGTSVGIGQSLEFYANFGWTGLLFGFFGLGFLLMKLDATLGRAFAERNTRMVLIASLPGLALQQPGGSLLEVLVSFVASFPAAFLAYRLLVHFGYERPLDKTSGEAPISSTVQQG